MSETPITPADRLSTAARWKEVDTQAVKHLLKVLADDVEVLTAYPAFHHLARVDSTVADLRRRLARLEAWEDILS